MKCKGLLSPHICDSYGANQGGNAIPMLFRQYMADLGDLQHRWYHSSPSVGRWSCTRFWQRDRSPKAIELSSLFLCQQLHESKWNGPHYGPLNNHLNRHPSIATPHCVFMLDTASVCPNKDVMKCNVARMKSQHMKFGRLQYKRSSVIRVHHKAAVLHQIYKKL